MGLGKYEFKTELKPTDATAQPINVEDGLVFYNNDGRQVGIKTDGDITDISIPVGTSFANDGTIYNYVYAANIKSFDMSQTPHTIDAPGFYDGSKANIDKCQANGRFTIGRKHSVKTNIIVSDIKQFTIKIGGYNYDVKFGQNFYNLTKKVLANFRNASGNPIYITQLTGTDYVPYILFDIQNGVIKEIGFGVKSTGTITTNVKVDVHVNTVQRSIIDATAVPSDVANGRIFYNNDGKQVGTSKILKSVTLVKGNKTIINAASDKLCSPNTDNNSLYMQSGSLSITQHYGMINIPDIDRILFITFKGVKYQCNLDSLYTKKYIFMDELVFSELNAVFMFDTVNKNIYCLGSGDGVIIEYL